MLFEIVRRPYQAFSRPASMASLLAASRTLLSKAAQIRSSTVVVASSFSSPCCCLSQQVRFHHPDPFNPKMTKGWKAALKVKRRRRNFNCWNVNTCSPTKFSLYTKHYSFYDATMLTANAIRSIIYIYIYLYINIYIYIFMY